MTVHTPLEAFATPKTLTELGIIGKHLLVKLSYGDTLLDKTGSSAWLGKLPITKKLTPFKAKQHSMDIDLSCVALDNVGEVLSVIWYGNLRNANQSIRHTGDTLRGSVDFEESLQPQESIWVRLQELPENVAHLVFVVSSEHDLSLAHKGMVVLADDEKHHAQKIDFQHLNASTKTIIAWHVQRKAEDFVVQIKAEHAHLNPKAHTADELIRLAKAVVLGSTA